MEAAPLARGICFSSLRATVRAAGLKTAFEIDERTETNERRASFTSSGRAAARLRTNTPGGCGALPENRGLRNERRIAGRHDHLGRCGGLDFAIRQTYNWEQAPSRRSLRGGA